jgi:hypothetical protein
MPSGSHDINVKLLALMGILSTILVFALVIATQAWFRYEFQQERQRKFIDVPFAELVELKESQLAQLNAPEHFADPAERDRRVIPIDDAIDAMVKKYGQGE